MTGYPYGWNSESDKTWTSEALDTRTRLKRLETELSELKATVRQYFEALDGWANNQVIGDRPAYLVSQEIAAKLRTLVEGR